MREGIKKGKPWLGLPYWLAESDDLEATVEQSGFGCVEGVTVGKAFVEFVGDLLVDTLDGTAVEALVNEATLAVYVGEFHRGLALALGVFHVGSPWLICRYYMGVY